MHLEDTSQGFPKINVILKTFAPLSQKSSVHVTEDTDMTLDGSFSTLFYSIPFT